MSECQTKLFGPLDVEGFTEDLKKAMENGNTIVIDPVPNNVPAVKDDELYFCPECGECFSVVEWNSSTLTLCNNRKARRDYIPFESKMETHRKKHTGYLCPGCQKMVPRLKIKN